MSTIMVLLWWALTPLVIPAEAGIHDGFRNLARAGTPAFSGLTRQREAL